MRELKFRAWDKENGVYLRPDETFLIAGNGYHPATFSFTFGYTANENLVLEQFTGLYDRDGKEIYEGDIVKISDAPVVSGKALVVKFDEFYIGEYNCNKMTGWMVQVINGGWAASLADEISRCEVIGNIHENKELLDVQ